MICTKNFRIKLGIYFANRSDVEVQSFFPIIIFFNVITQQMFCHPKGMFYWNTIFCIKALCNIIETNYGSITKNQFVL